jgi:hypothetical protein
MKNLKVQLVGMQYRKNECYLAQEKVNKTKKWIFNLQKEPDNEFDSNAVRVNLHNIHIGYVEADKSKEVTDMLDTYPNVVVEKIETLDNRIYLTLETK